MRQLVVGTAGHIDHGKSAIVKALTGTDPDRLKEEQLRGITIDLGFAHAVMGDVDVAFVDVPGHERFVRNMLAGAGGIDAVVLVIAADESVMPQTREHFEICRLLGLERGIIVLSKSDRVDAEALAAAAQDARDLVAGSFLDEAPIIATSVRTGAGLDTVRTALEGLAGPASRRARSGVVRLPIDRVFTVRGFGTVVTGTLVSGEIVAGQDLVLLPGARVVRARGVQVHGQNVPRVSAPGRTAINLGAIEVSEIARGMTLASPDALVMTSRLDVKVEVVRDARPLGHGQRVHVHQGTAVRMGRVAMCAVWRPADETWTMAGVGQPAVEIPPGGQGYVRVRLDEPLPLSRGDQLILRRSSPAATIAGGVVLDPAPPRAGLRRASTLDRFRALEVSEAVADDSVPGVVRTWLTEAGPTGLRIRDLVARGGLDPPRSERIVALLEAEGAVVVDDRVIDARVCRAIQQRIADTLSAHHAARPREPGLARDMVRARAAAGAPPGVIDAMLVRMATAGQIAGSDLVRLAVHHVTATPKDQQEEGRVEAALRKAGLTPPDPAALASATGLTPAGLDEVLRVLARAGRAARSGDLWFHTTALEKLKQEVLQLGAGRTSTALARIDVATFKTRYGLSRKFAIPLLEWLDRERVTRRVGDARVILGG